MKLKMVVSFFLMLSAVSFSSLAQSIEASNKLSIDIGNSSALVIPASTYSCAEVASGKLEGSGSIVKNYFRLPNPKISWSGDSVNAEIRIDLMLFKLNSSQTGNYQCSLSGGGLGNLFYKRSVDANGMFRISLWDGKFGSESQSRINSTTELSKLGYSKCDIICGGLEIKEGSGPFSVEGTWEVYGVERKYSDSSLTSYEETPLVKKGKFTVENVLD